MTKWGTKWYKVSFAPMYVKVNDVNMSIWTERDVPSNFTDYKETVRETVYEALRTFLMDKLTFHTYVELVDTPHNIHPEMEVVEFGLGDFEILHKRFSGDKLGW